MKSTEHDKDRVSGRLLAYDDNELVRLARFQLPYVTTAYEVLFHRYHAPLIKVCFRYLGSQEEAEETVSDTMFNVFNNLSSFEEKASFKTWIYRIAYNLSMTRLRKKQLTYVELDEALNVPDDAHKAPTTDERKQVNQWLNSLSLEDRSIVVFRVVACLEFGEIADIVDQKLSTVKMRFKRALEKMGDNGNRSD